jgi:hypothetical protein
MKNTIRLFAVAMTSLIFLLASLLISTSETCACPFCSGPSLTLAEQIEDADIVLVVSWISAEGKDDLAGIDCTTFEFSDSLRGGSKWKPRQRIKLDRYSEGREGDLFLLFGSIDRKIAWLDPLPITKATIEYARRAPGPEVEIKCRLLFFLDYLESPDKIVAEDAMREFANADYTDVEKIKDHLSREKLRKWLTDPKTESSRLGLYGMLLGLCGTTDDVSFMVDIISRNDGDELRFGIGGLMGGYLLLTGDIGVEYLERTKLKPTDVSFVDTYDAVQALRFAWTYAEDKVSRERLKTAMRTVLYRENMADLIIPDLARWKDWESLPLLTRLYDDDPHTSAKRAIVRFANACSRDVSKDASLPEPQHVAEGRKALEELRRKDPKLLADALRFVVNSTPPETSRPRERAK